MQILKKITKLDFFESPYIRWIILLYTTVIVTLSLYPNILQTSYYYKLGDIAERGIKAPLDLLVEDKDATAETRRKALLKVLTVYDYDDTLVNKLLTQINEAFSHFRELSNEMAKLKNNEIKKETTQETSQNPKTYTSNIENVNQDSDQNKSQNNNINQTPENKNNLKINKDFKIFLKKSEFESKLGLKISEANFETLIKEKFSQYIEELISYVLKTILNNGVVSNKELLLQELKKGIILKYINSNKEEIINDVRPYYDIDRAKAMVWIVGQPLLKNLNYNSISMIVDIVQGLIQPNITVNKRDTEKRKEDASELIKPILFQIKAGEMLLREGERVQAEQILKLEALRSFQEKEKTFSKSVGLSITILTILIILHICFIGPVKEVNYNYNKDLFFISLLLILFVFITEISISLFKSISHDGEYSISITSIILGIPVASGAMTICLFKGLNRAIPFGFITSICAAILYQNELDMFIFFFLNSTMGAYWLVRCRERNVFIKAGVKIGLLNVLIITSLRAYSSELFLSKIFWDWIFGYIGGLSAGIVTAGIAPLMEITFGYTTDIKLMELANLDKPLLHRLMLEAPGTYHHSVIVGSMVEAAAAEIGANPLLAKVCGYYHDIGKMKNPLYFIENQPKGYNRHDKLAPSMSSLIIIAHVKHGVELAKEHKLGKEIIHTIEQHHGTSMISFFYEKAKQKKGEKNINEADFRYPGPKPQTREAGLVMLGDVVEAASRALENPTPARIQGVVHKLINKIFSDGQLDNCELTLKDLHKIAKTFNKILNGIHHHRIEYSDNVSKQNGKVKNKNGSSDRKQTKKSDKHGESQASHSENLKRLGLS